MLTIQAVRLRKLVKLIRAPEVILAHGLPKLTLVEAQAQSELCTVLLIAAVELADSLIKLSGGKFEIVRVLLAPLLQVESN